MRFARVLPILVLICIVAGSASAGVGGTPGNARAWTEQVIRSFAGGRSEEARRQVLANVPDRDRASFQSALDTVSAFFRDKGKLQVLDLADEKLRGTSVLVFTYFVRMDQAEAFMQVRFHRSATEWEFRHLDLQSDYKKILWD